MNSTDIALLGIFVGGKSSRMGGRPKGLLLARDTGEPLVVRSARLAQQLGIEAVLVGFADPYVSLLPNLRVLEDDPKNVGPLGGLGGLLQAAQGRRVLAVACDMPNLSAALLARVANEQPAADVLAARNAEGFWEPLCARYDAARALPALRSAMTAGVRSFQALFARVAASELILSEEERTQLLDWDSPADVTRH